MDAWIRKVGSLITARNRLLEMYNRFGAAVLLDPVWNVNTLAAHRSNLFSHVFRAVAERLAVVDGTAGFEFLVESHEHASRVLFLVVATMGSKDDAQYVASFLEDNPPANIPLM